MPPQSVPHRAYNSSKSGPKARGRPRKKWIDSVRDTLNRHGLTTTTASRLAVSRQLYLPTTPQMLAVVDAINEALVVERHVWRRVSILEWADYELPALEREYLEPPELEREDVEHTQAEDPHVSGLDFEDMNFADHDNLDLADHDNLDQHPETVCRRLYRCVVTRASHDSAAKNNKGKNQNRTYYTHQKWGLQPPQWQQPQTIHYTYSPHPIHYPIPIHPHNPFPTHPFPSYPYHLHNPPPPFIPPYI
ncbi:hypothetical protein Bbelb_373150 [Branchiostoma belcheri]|nr:hypothetical protein Bbelb_373150 [Branchiostoma belcheri]